MAHSNEGPLQGPYYPDVCGWLMALEALTSRPTAPADLVSSAPMGRLVAGALQGAYAIDSSTHVLKLVRAKAQEKLGYTEQEAAAAMQAIRLLVERSGGQISTAAQAAPLIPVAQQTVPWHLHGRPGARKTGVDHEDFTMLAGALATGSAMVVTYDNAVLNARAPFFQQFELAIVSPQELASRRVI